MQTEDKGKKKPITPDVGSRPAVPSQEIIKNPTDPARSPSKETPPTVSSEKSNETIEKPADKPEKPVENAEEVPEEVEGVRWGGSSEEISPPGKPTAVVKPCPQYTLLPPPEQENEKIVDESADILDNNQNISLEKKSECYLEADTQKKEIPVSDIQVQDSDNNDNNEKEVEIICDTPEEIMEKGLQ